MITVDLNFHWVNKIIVKKRKENWIDIILKGEDNEQELTVFFNNNENCLKFLEELKTGTIEIRE